MIHIDLTKIYIDTLILVLTKSNLIINETFLTNNILGEIWINRSIFDPSKIQIYFKYSISTKYCITLQCKYFNKNPH